jgi:hypothetical protein
LTVSRGSQVVSWRRPSLYILSYYLLASTRRIAV